MERIAAGVALVLLLVLLIVMGLVRDPVEETIPVPDEVSTTRRETAAPTSGTSTMAAATATTATSVAVPHIVGVSIPLQDTVPSEWFHDLVAVSADEIWVVLDRRDGTSGGTIGHRDDGEWALYGLSDDEAPIAGLAAAPDGTIWAATSVGVFSFDGARWTRRFDGPAAGIAVAADGTTWIGGPRVSEPWEVNRLWLARGDGARWERVDPEPHNAPQPGGRALIVVRASGDVWIAHRAGVWVEHEPMRYDGDAMEITPIGDVTDQTPDNGIPAIGVSSLDVTPDGSVWSVGYLAADPTQTVVSRFDGTAWHRYEWPYPDPDGVAADVDAAVGPDAVIWFAFDRGLASFDGTAWTRHVEGGEVFDVDVAADGAVWYSDRSGVHLADRTGLVSGS
jgi:hypothetical protein